MYEKLNYFIIEKSRAMRERARLEAFLLEMGPKFKVLIQHKGVGKVLLSGLVFPDFFMG